MLVLSRRLGEKLVLTTPEGREVVVVVMGIERGRVRLGVEAPRDVKVYRDGPPAAPPAPTEGGR